ncbi:hypothetical protein D3C76_1551110 [compost metagenome]
MLLLAFNEADPVPTELGFKVCAYSPGLSKLRLETAVKASVYCAGRVRGRSPIELTPKCILRCKV